jgi:uncharacterized protein YkwD
MTSLVLGITLVALLGSNDIADAGSAPATRVTVAVRDRSSDADAMLQDVNARRAAQGLPPLQFDPALNAIARAHAQDMAQRSYFGHNTPEGVSPFDRMDRAHYQYGYAGENIALDRNVGAAANALWHSPEHRENILETHYSKVGIGAVLSPDGEIFVEDFSD